MKRSLVALILNSVLLASAHAGVVFEDPRIGKDAGWKFFRGEDGTIIATDGPPILMSRNYTAKNVPARYSGTFDFWIFDEKEWELHPMNTPENQPRLNGGDFGSYDREIHLGYSQNYRWGRVAYTSTHALLVYCAGGNEDEPLVFIRDDEEQAALREKLEKNREADGSHAISAEVRWPCPKTNR